MLNRSQSFRSSQADVAHVADIENAYSRPHGVVLGDYAPCRRVFDGHLSAIEFDHFCAHLAMDRVERGLADGWRDRLNSGQ